MPEHMSDPTYVISRAFGNVDVDYCFNPSAMTSESDYIGFLKDGVQASTHQMGRITPEVGEFQIVYLLLQQKIT